MDEFKGRVATVKDGAPFAIIDTRESIQIGYNEINANPRWSAGRERSCQRSVRLPNAVMQYPKSRPPRLPHTVEVFPSLCNGTTVRLISLAFLLSDYLLVPYLQLQSPGFQQVFYL